jgi:hypothetical protein
MLRERTVMRTWSCGVISLVLGFAACSPKTSTRMVDDPTGQATEYGAPQNPQYTAQVDTSMTRARITLFQRSECAVIPVTVMQRYEESLRGGEVISRTPVTKKQVAGNPTGVQPCDATYARNAEVLIAAGDARHSAGQTDAHGVVEVDLAKLFQVGSFEQVPDQVRVVVRPQRAQNVVDVGTLSLSELKRREVRLGELLQKMEAILGKGETGASSAEIGESYQIYEQLHELGPNDPRVLGLSARFWELYLGRKQEEARVKMERNLAALSSAKETLKVMGDAAIPLYVQVAVNSGTLDQGALEWSTLRLIRALRGQNICASGFSFSSVQSYGWPVDARLAAEYVNYGYGDGYSAVLNKLCAPGAR